MRDRDAIRRRNEGVGIGDGRAEHDRMMELKEQGLCTSCGNYPYNPEVAGSLCTQCWRESGFSCGHTGCDNSAVVDVNQRPACSLHAVEMAHDMYADYVLQKCRVEDLERELDRVKEEVGYDPKADNSLPPERREDAERVLGKQAELHMERQELGRLRKMIDRVNQQVDQVFPDGFDPAF